MDLFKCKCCGKMIDSKHKRFFHFVKCEHCKQEFQLQEKHLGYYNMLPFISVFISVLISIYIVRSSDIFIKCIVIIGGSYLIYYIICLLWIQKGFLKFQKRNKKE